VLPLMSAIGVQETPERRESLPTITAANLSARFPVVSPVGSIRLKLAPIPAQPSAPLEYLRFADGGYYENSGAATLRDVLETVVAVGGTRIRPIVVQISNDPDALWPPRWQRTADQARLAATLEEADPAPVMGELLSPVRTMLNTRSARGVEEREELASLVGGSQAGRRLGADPLYLHFMLCQSDGDEPPLGWYLSEQTQDLIDRHLSDAQTCAPFGVDNVATLQRLADAVVQR
jgi:hypothetical protein